MRAVVSLLIVVLIIFAVYRVALKQMPTTDRGTASTHAISLTGVRSDLLQIGQAERRFMAENGHCASFDELISSNAMTVSRSGRDGYSYSVDCSGSDFSVTARHAPAPKDSPVRFPTLALDQTMQVRELNN